jgi:hypothetical protein
MRLEIAKASADREAVPADGSPTPPDLIAILDLLGRLGLGHQWAGSSRIPDDLWRHACYA